MNHDILMFVTLNRRINFGNDSYTPGIILDKGEYEIMEWSHHNQTHDDYRYDYLDLIKVDTRERIHFMLYHPENYSNLFTVHTEFVPVCS